MDFDSEVLRFAAQSNERIEQMFNDYFDDLAAIGIKTPKDSGVFSFDKDVPPQYREKVDQLTKSFQERLYKEIHAGVDVAYGISLAKHTALLSALFPEGLNVHQPRRKDAREAFIRQRTKPTGRLSLNDRVWNYANQGKAEVEAAMSLAIEDGVVQGKTAAELGRSLRKYLNDPDRMYRRYHTTITLADGSKKDIVTWRKRVIGPDGKVHFVETEIDKPGQGVYISARANAERCSRSEINGAYRYADYERWNDEEFVIGIKISLSNNHTVKQEMKVGKRHVTKAVPFHDICDDLQGNYPKTFKWAGWHPQCRCHATAITASKEDRKQWLAEGCQSGFFDDKYIKDAPPQMVKWLNENMDKVQRAKSLPYWIQDNLKVKNTPKGEEKIVSLFGVGMKKPAAMLMAPSKTKVDDSIYRPSSLRNTSSAPKQSVASQKVKKEAFDFLDLFTDEKNKTIIQLDKKTKELCLDLNNEKVMLNSLLKFTTPCSTLEETIERREKLAKWLLHNEMFGEGRVFFDKESGTLLALHKGHRLDKFNKVFFGDTISPNELEIECTKELLGNMKSGRCVIMLNEFAVDATGKPLSGLDLMIDGSLADISSVTKYGNFGNAIANKSAQLIKFMSTRKIKADTMVLYFHDTSFFNKEVWDASLTDYLEQTSKKHYVKKIIIVAKDKGVIDVRDVVFRIGNKQ